MAPFTNFEVRIDERWWNRLIVGYEQGPMSTTRRKTLNRYARRFIESAISEKIEREKGGMTMPCMCGDIYCHSCGPMQGNSHCEICGRWSMDGGCENLEKCIELAKIRDEAEADYYRNEGYSR